MKVAVCLSGQTRTIERCVDSLLEFVINPLQADVFWHFWTDSIVSDKLYEKWYQLQAPPQWPEFCDKLALDIFNKLKPKQFIVQPQMQFDTLEFERNCTKANSRLQAVNFHHPLSMYFSIFAANACKRHWERKNNFTYDCVIRCRPDMLFNMPISNDWLSNLNKVYIPSDHGYGGYNDQFAFSNSNNIDIYSNCFNSISQIFKSGTNFHPESLLKQYLSNNQLDIVGIPMIYELTR
jgi:hypothetical protein